MVFISKIFMELIYTKIVVIKLLLRPRSGPRPWALDNIVHGSSVAEPEQVEQQLFAGAGAKVFLARLRSRVYKFL
jgi:hypothetical protein